MATPARSKRGHGEGTIEQRANGTFRAVVMIAGKWHSGEFKTKRDAQRWLRGLAADADRGVLPPAEKLTLTEFFARWLDQDVRHTCKPRTHESYSSTARLYILPTLGKLQVAKIRSEQLQKLYSQLIDKGLSPKTVRIVHGTIRSALAKAVIWKLIHQNVAVVVKAPRVKRAEIAFLNDIEAKQLLAVVRGDRWEGLIGVALGSGMRQGEMLGLKWSDINFDANTVRIERQLGRDGVLVELKGDARRRTISLPKFTMESLLAYRLIQDQWRKLQGGKYNDQGLIFTTETGRHLNWRNVTRAFKSLLKRGALPNIPFHGMRHTNATLLLLKGVHPKVVQVRLGHSSISITLDIYSHFIPDMDTDAVAKLNAALT